MDIGLKELKEMQEDLFKQQCDLDIQKAMVKHFIKKQEAAIPVTHCCTELKVDKKAEINKLNDLLKDTEEDEGLKLNNPIEWGRRVGYLEGKINYLCSL